MSSFKGFEVVPITDFGCSGWSMIRITVSAMKVGLSKPLIEAMGNPEHITFHRGVGENEGKMIIAAAEQSEEQGQIHINLANKKISFCNSEFSESCAEMVKTYAGGNFGKGTYYSIGGSKIEDGAFVFDFHDAMEHNVKMGMRGMGGNPATRQRPGTFPMPDRNVMQDRVSAMPGRAYNMQERSARV